MFVRRCLQFALAVCAALASWTVMESLIQLQPRFPSYIVYTAASGALFGAVWGLFLGAADGIALENERRLVSGSLVSAIIAAFGGALGFLSAQGLLFVVGEYVVTNSIVIQEYVAPAARAVGWAVLAAITAAAPRIISGSPRRITIGALGGLGGGLAGGVVIEFALSQFPMQAGAHLAGLLAFALLVALAPAFVEKGISFGVVRVLNGPYAGREYALDRRRTLVGSAPEADVLIPSARDLRARRKAAPAAGSRPNISGISCRIVARGRDLFLEPIEGAIWLNDQRIEPEPAAATKESPDERRAQQLLRYDDVVGCGGVKLLIRRA